MSGGACAVIIVTSQAEAASDSMRSFAAGSLLTPEQSDRVTNAGAAYVAELNAVAAEIPDPEND